MILVVFGFQGQKRHQNEFATKFNGMAITTMFGKKYFWNSSWVFCYTVLFHLKYKAINKTTCRMPLRNLHQLESH